MTDRPEADWGYARLLLRSIAVLVLCLLSSSVLAQAARNHDNWPDRPIRLIVPFPAGGAVDVVARIIANQLGPSLGQQFVVENRAGASGTLGSDAVARSVPDGYTVGIGTTSTHALAVTLNPKLTYDPLKDFAHVAMIGSAPYVLAVRPNLPATTVRDLIEVARRDPGKLTYASAGVASMAHLAGALFEQLANVELTHVPYRSSAQSVTDMVGGRIDMQFATIAPFLPQIRDGAVRALATSGSKRVSALPDTPTVAEAGLPGFEAALWMAFFMAPKTPPAIIERMNKEISAVLQLPDVQKDLLAQGIEIESGTPAQLAARVEADIKRWQGVAGKIGLAGK